jgi:uncharacterized membrane protein
MTGREEYKPGVPVYRILNTVSLSCLVCIYILVLYAFVRLPHRIPTHFDLTGKADAFGSKNILLIMLIIATVLFVLITFLSNKRGNNQATGKTASTGGKSKEYIKTLFNLAKFLVSLSFLLIITMILLRSFPKYNSTLAHGISIALIAIPAMAIMAVIVFFKNSLGNSSR